MDAEECSTGLEIEKHWNFYLFFSFCNHKSFHLLMKKKLCKLKFSSKETYLPFKEISRGKIEVWMELQVGFKGA